MPYRLKTIPYAVRLALARAAAKVGNQELMHRIANASTAR